MKSPINVVRYSKKRNMNLGTLRRREANDADFPKGEKLITGVVVYDEEEIDAYFQKHPVLNYAPKGKENESGNKRVSKMWRTDTSLCNSFSRWKHSVV